MTTREEEIQEEITELDFMLMAKVVNPQKLATYLAGLEAKIERNWKHRNDSDD